MALFKRHVGLEGKAASCRLRNLLSSASLEGDFALATFAALTCASSASNDLILS